MWSRYRDQWVSELSNGPTSTYGWRVEWPDPAERVPASCETECRPSLPLLREIS